MKKLIIIAICIFLSFILAIGIIWPKYQDFRNNQRKAQDIENEIQSRKEYWEKLRAISERLRRYQEPLSKINLALPDNPLILDLFIWKGEQAARTGLILKEISAGATVPVELEIPVELGVPVGLEIQKTEISLAVSGSYDSFQRFLSVLENSARLIKIENISFSFPEEEEPFVFNIITRVYNYLWQ